MSQFKEALHKHFNSMLFYIMQRCFQCFRSFRIWNRPYQIIYFINCIRFFIGILRRNNFLVWELLVTLIVSKKTRISTFTSSVTSQTGCFFGRSKTSHFAFAWSEISMKKRFGDNSFNDFWKLFSMTLYNSSATKYITSLIVLSILEYEECTFWIKFRRNIFCWHIS